MIHCTRLKTTMLHPDTCLLRQTNSPKFDAPFCLPCAQGITLLESVYFLEGKPINPIILKKQPKYQICPVCGQERKRKYWKIWVCECPESEARIEAIRVKRRAKYYLNERTSDKPLRENRK